MLDCESQILAAAATLLRRRTPLADWPVDARQALLGALSDAGLAGYLFRDRTPLPGDPALAWVAGAARLRLDLATLVPEGAGDGL